MKIYERLTRAGRSRIWSRTYELFPCCRVSTFTVIYLVVASKITVSPISINIQLAENKGPRTVFYRTVNNRVDEIN